MSAPVRSISVIGGGIGGLAAALALARRGFEVTVVEQAHALREVGAGLQISPNGMAVLQALGVAEAVAETAPQARGITMVDGIDGQALQRLDIGDLTRLRPWCLVHRGDLLTHLAAACRAAGVHFRLGAKVTSVANAGEAAQIQFDDGSEATTPLAICADGVGSVSRDVVLGAPSTPRFSGQVAWRATVPMTASVPAEVQVYLGPGRHVVVYPLRDRRLLNLVAVEERRQWTEEGWRHRDDPSAVRTAFAEFADPVTDLLQRVEEVHVWGLFLHQVAPRWHRGRLVLLGDAAHPTLPFLAQGACMALEDAWVLAARLAADPSPNVALAAYELARKARCQRIVAGARRNARLFHLSGPARLAARTGLRLAGRIAPGAALRQLDWLYRHDVTAMA